MLIAVVSGFVLALAAPLLHKLLRNATGWVLALLPLGIFLYLAGFIGSISSGETWTFSYPWIPSLDVNFSFYLDGLSLTFGLLITGIGALIMIYAGGYLSWHHHQGRFYAYITGFMASMLGLVLADNLISLFVFWELTSLTSYLLIGFDHERQAARAAALQALLVTGAGGLALLAGFLMLGQVGGTMEMSQLLAHGDAIRSHALYMPILITVLAGAFTKSAQFPFHFWLPNAMEAPTPVSAYLHSATMVKAGVYLLARVNPVLGDTEPWHLAVTAAGATTMLVGGFLALLKTDLKQILAYSTISALGMLVMLIGLGSPEAARAASVILVAHALYKGSLFMIAGAIDHETGTRNIDELGGLRGSMPLTSAIAVLAAVSLAGFGPVLNFIGKELLLESVLASDLQFILTSAAVTAGAFFVAVAGIVAIKPFFGEAKATPKQPHEAPLSLLLGPGILAAAGLIFGVFPSSIARTLIQPTVGSILGQIEPVILELWHGINRAFVLSVVSVVLGFAGYLCWRLIRRLGDALNRVLELGPARWYSLALDGLNLLARVQTRILQNGYLRVYLAMIIVTTVSLAGYSISRERMLSPVLDWSDIRFFEACLGVLILAAAVAATQSKSRLGAVAALGVVGYSVALIFITFGAPDLAMTQFLIETLTVILLVLVLYHLPRFATISGRPSRLRDALLALSAGGLMTVLVLVAIEAESEAGLTRYFAEHSVPDAHGRNIVNVILVDFRGTDTLGEITVLAVAAIGVYALLKLRFAGGKK